MSYPNPSQFVAFLKGWRTSLIEMIPNWQTKRPGLLTGFSWLFSMALPVDIELESLLQGINDWAPGSANAHVSQFPYIAQSRGMIQGEAETNAHFAQRLIDWRTNGLFTPPAAVPQVWNQTGKTELLAQKIQQYLGNNPTVRIIERIFSTSGSPTANYVTAKTDGTTATQVAAWDWDSALGWTDDATTWTGAQCRTFWSDFWIVVYPCEWGRGASVTPLTGQLVPQVAHDAIMRLVAQHKGAHTFCRGILWSYNVALFDPATPGAAGNPTGDWGNWAKLVAGNQVPARNIVDVRYWIPPRG